MTNIWISSDPHFSHEGMLRFLTKRGERMRTFANVVEMDQRILDEHNALVKSTDHHYCLGDVAMRQSQVKMASFLNGKKRLVRGNHDIYPTKTYLNAGFKEIYGTRVFAPDKAGDPHLIFSHIPLHPNSVKRGWVNVHGHVHNNIEPGSLGPQYLNVSLEVTDYKPLNIETLRQMARTQLQAGDSMRFRKKPVEIDAFQFDGANHAEVRAWAKGLGYEGGVFEFEDGKLAIPTLEGVTVASPGDYVIRGVKGEYYACKPDIFAATYDAVEEQVIA